MNNQQKQTYDRVVQRLIKKYKNYTEISKDHVVNFLISAYEDHTEDVYVSIRTNEDIQDYLFNELINSL